MKSRTGILVLSCGRSGYRSFANGPSSTMLSFSEPYIRYRFLKIGYDS